MSMKAMCDLRDMLCKELDEIAHKGELGAGDLDIAHKLVSTIKNIDKIDLMENEGYSRDGDFPSGVTPATATIPSAGIPATATAAAAPTHGVAPIMCAAIIAATAQG